MHSKKKKLKRNYHDPFFVKLFNGLFIEQKLITTGINQNGMSSAWNRDFRGPEPNGTWLLFNYLA